MASRVAAKIVPPPPFFCEKRMNNCENQFFFCKKRVGRRRHSVVVFRRFGGLKHVVLCGYSMSFLSQTELKKIPSRCSCLSLRGVYNWPTPIGEDG